MSTGENHILEAMRIIVFVGDIRIEWEEVTTYFIIELPRIRRKCDTIWKIVDRLTKSTYFLAIRAKTPLESLVRLSPYRLVFGKPCHLRVIRE